MYRENSKNKVNNTNNNKLKRRLEKTESEERKLARCCKVRVSEGLKTTQQPYKGSTTTTITQQ